MGSELGLGLGLGLGLPIAVTTLDAHLVRRVPPLVPGMLPVHVTHHGARAPLVLPDAALGGGAEREAQVELGGRSGLDRVWAQGERWGLGQGYGSNQVGGGSPG